MTLGISSHVKLLIYKLCGYFLHLPVKTRVITPFFTNLNMIAKRIMGSYPYRDYHLHQDYKYINKSLFTYLVETKYKLKKRKIIRLKWGSFLFIFHCFYKCKSSLLIKLSSTT